MNRELIRNTGSGDVSSSPGDIRAGMIEDHKISFPYHSDRFHSRAVDKMISDEKPVSSYTEEGFNLGRELYKRNGPFVEFAGPTNPGFEDVDYKKLDRPVFVSNLTNGNPVRHSISRKFLGFYGNIDFRADSQKLPFGKESLGALFGSCPHTDTVPATIVEAGRVLEPGGLLILRHITSMAEAEKNAEAFGFIKKSETVIADSRENLCHNYIFQREK